MTPTAGGVPSRGARSGARSDAIEWKDARRAAFSAVAPGSGEDVSLPDAIGRVLARDIIALQDIPHYASSAMDGWAVHGEGPWVVATGVSPLPEGSAARIVTGGAIPDGADRVARWEDVAVHGATVELLARARKPALGSDVRPAAQEARRGDALVVAGTVLNPAHIAVAASCAVDAIQVSVRPRVALVLTGDEVIERGLPTTGQVRDSFGPQLPALIGMLGGVVTSSRRVSDQLRSTIDAIASAAVGADLIVTTGGTGDSAADHVRPALREFGAELLVPHLAVRPGGPSLLARLPDGTLVVGLAGNPLAAITGLLVLASPLMAARCGREFAEPQTVTTMEMVPGHPRATLIIPYRSTGSVATPSTWIGSAMMRGLAESDGLLVVPPAGLPAGSRADALPLPWPAT